MNPNLYPRSSHRDPNRAAIAAVTVTILGGILLAGGKGGSESDPGQPQRDHKDPVEHAGGAQPGSESEQGSSQEHHPLPWYESDKGPDGEIDYFAHKHTENGVTSYRIDGGTPAPAPEQPQK